MDHHREKISWWMLPFSHFVINTYDIYTSRQKEGESLGEAYKIFKKILSVWPTHNFYDTDQMQIFCNNLKLKTN